MHYLKLPVCFQSFFRKGLLQTVADPYQAVSQHLLLLLEDHLNALQLLAVVDTPFQVPSEWEKKFKKELGQLIAHKEPRLVSPHIELRPGKDELPNTLVITGYLRSAGKNVEYEFQFNR